MYNGRGLGAEATSDTLTQAYQSGGDAALLAAKRQLAIQQSGGMTTTTVLPPPLSPSPSLPTAPVTAVPYVPKILIAGPVPVETQPVSQGTTPLPVDYPAAVPVSAPLVSAVASPAVAQQVVSQAPVVPGAALPDGTVTSLQTAGFDPTTIALVIGGAVLLTMLSGSKRRAR